MKSLQMALISSLIFLTVSFSSCKKENAKKAVENFIGSYTVSESCSGGSDNYEIAITKSSNADNEILIGNFYNVGALITATVNGNDLTIPTQTGDGKTFSGNGTLSNNLLTLNFLVDGTSCVASCQKK
jgi:hypothetical protein